MMWHIMCFCAGEPCPAPAPLRRAAAQDDRLVKLHATVISIRLAQDRDGLGELRAGGGPSSSSFDVRRLLRQHGNVDLGSVTAAAVHLSVRGSFDAASGYYACAAGAPLT